MAIWTERKQNFQCTPLCYAEADEPGADVKGYFDAIVASDHPEYKGMVPIATKCGGSVRIITSVPAERIGGMGGDDAYISPPRLLLRKGSNFQCRDLGQRKFFCLQRYLCRYRCPRFRSDYSRFYPNQRSLLRFAG